MKNNPILVTGAHRSGSTWTGKILSSSPAVHYVHEPFNIGMDRPKSPLTFWFEYLSENTPVAHQEDVKNYLATFYRPSFKDIVKNFLKIKSFGDFGIFTSRFLGLKKNRTLFKDPIAIMSCEWLHKEIGCDVIIVIRHPAAFVASLKVKGWEFDFKNYLDQDYLMQNYLGQFADEITEMVKGNPSIIEQGILLWKTLYGTVQQYKEKYGDQWYFVKHEELSLNPVEEFRKMYEFTGLDFTPSIRKEIEKTTLSSVSTRNKRNSEENIKTWKKRLTKEEIEQIKEGTESVWVNFYTEDDWL